MNIIDFYRSYQVMVQGGLTSVNLNELDKAIDVIKNTASRRGNCYVGGNGGSAAIGNHLCCDFLKGTYSPGHSAIKPVCLSANPSVITAIANDISYDQTISYQLDKHLEEEDLVILISSSGNSPNIVKAAELCVSRGVTLIGMTGFDGGRLKELADVKLHVPVKNYGVVEDCHQALMHIISQYIAKERELNVGIGSGREAPRVNP